LGQISMVRLLDDIKNAIGKGSLAKFFTPASVERVVKGYSHNTYMTFFAKHMKGNPWDYPEYFEQHPDGQYSLVEESTKPVPTSQS
jgi:hypothetical protein